MDANWTTLVASAGIGAVVASLVNVVGQTLDRRARREDLLWTKALEMAHLRGEFILQIAKDTGRRTRFYDPVIIAETYHRWLTHLVKHGRLPNEARVRRGRPPEPPEPRRPPRRPPGSVAPPGSRSEP